MSDEAIVDRWIENPYWQHFTGEQVFQKEKPFDPTEFIHFIKRVGKEGAEILLKVSVKLFGKEAEEKEVLVDSTVQEKNITYPTDAKPFPLISLSFLTLFLSFTPFWAPFPTLYASAFHFFEDVLLICMDN